MLNLTSTVHVEVNFTFLSQKMLDLEATRFRRTYSDSAALTKCLILLLQVLSLARTGLRSFESLYIPSLETLDLSGNQLVHLPEPMDGFRVLQHLDLSSNHISTLVASPSHIYESLRFLNLSHNGLSFVLNQPFEKMISLDVVSGSFSWMY